MSDRGPGSEQAAQNLFSITTDGYTAHCFIPKSRLTDKIVYMYAAMPEDAEKVWQHLSCHCVLVCVEGIDWNRDMSPWYHKKVFSQGEDFAGGADAYLSVFCERLIPEIEYAVWERAKNGELCRNSDIAEEFCRNGEIKEKAAGMKRYLVGYSLGGLFALYAPYRTALFDGVGSVSGSLWYEGLLPYMESHSPCRIPEKAYFSLGDKENRGNAKMRTVAERTMQARELFRRMGVRTYFEWNPGDHFRDAAGRMARGIDWLSNENEKEMEKR